jgi:hypothetical protein
VDGLSPRAARLYRALLETGASPINRRQAAALLDGSYNTAKRALAELVAQELLRVVDRGPPAQYALLDCGGIGAPGGLLAPAALEAASRG